MRKDFRTGVVGVQESLGGIKDQKRTLFNATVNGKDEG